MILVQLEKYILKNKDGKIVDNSHFGEIFVDLDKLPIPAWELRLMKDIGKSEDRMEEKQNMVKN